MRFFFSLVLLVASVFVFPEFFENQFKSFIKFLNKNSRSIFFKNKNYVKTRIFYVENIPCYAKIFKDEICPGNIYGTVNVVLNKKYKGSNSAFVLNECGGELFFSKKGNFYDFKKHASNSYSIFKEYLNSRTLSDGILTFRNGEFKITSTYRPTNHNDLFCFDFHDNAVLKNGNYLVLGYDRVFVKKKILLQPFIQEITVDGKVVKELKIDDALIYLGDHSNKRRIAVDLFHANTICVDDDENILISNRNLSQVIKVDKNSGKIIWRLGGKSGDFKFLNDRYSGFSYQHAARRISNGNILLFDNGRMHTPKQTRIAEYKIDEKNKTAELVWEYLEKGIYAQCMGYVQELKNENRLITWGKIIDSEKTKYKYKNFIPQITEINQKGEKIFEVYFPKGVYLYKVQKF